MLSNRLKIGNSKLDKVLIFDLPAIKSCLNSTLCSKSCYALKAQKMYPNVRKWRDDNLSLAKQHPKALLFMIHMQLTSTKYTVCRIHSSGDFFSQEYVDLWYEIVKRFPKIKFYAYTKVDKLLNFRKLKSLPNFNLIPSLINGKLNFGPKPYVDQLVIDEGAFLCPAHDKKIKCNLHCNYCVSNNKPVFIQH
jgi:hypothetical protein